MSLRRLVSCFVESVGDGGEEVHGVQVMLGLDTARNGEENEIKTCKSEICEQNYNSD